MTESANHRTNDLGRVSGESPRPIRTVASSKSLRKPAQHIVLRSAPQPPETMSHPRLRDPFPKSRCVRRELYPRGASYRPTASRRLRDNCGLRPPSRYLKPDGPYHDPLSVGRQRKAGEASGPRYGQGSYTELKSVASTPHPSPAREGRHSGMRTYGERCST